MPSIESIAWKLGSSFQVRATTIFYKRVVCFNL